MRAVVWLILLCAAAVVAAALLGRNDAMVSVFYGQWRVDLSLNLALLLGLAVFALMFAAWRAISTLVRLPQQAREWRSLKRERAAWSALCEAMTEHLAGRYARAKKAAQRALELQSLTLAMRDDTQFTALSHVLAAAAAHRVRDREGRDAAIAAAQTALEPSALRGNSATADGVRLLAAGWALEERDAERGAQVLAELSAGAARRTVALRLRLQAARQRNQPLEAMQIARLLAKHQGFSEPAAKSLLRSLAGEALRETHDIDQLQRVWQALDASDRSDAWVVSRAARRACALQRPDIARQWLLPLWQELAQLEPEARRELALTLAQCAADIGPDWLPRVEKALAQQGHDSALLAAAAAVYAERRLWGKARWPLEQTAKAVDLPGNLRRQALRDLARMAREQSDETAATGYERQAGAIEL